MKLSPRALYWIGFSFVFIASYFTYMHNYMNPQGFFWDENYHIASAQKYLHGVYFMEPHPPLGKLMIAAGEAMFQANENSDQFIATDYARNPDSNFSFIGYRFFPTLFAWLNALLFFQIFYSITRNSVWSVLLSFLYVFDNALIVHQRSAMLESTLQFGVLLMICTWLTLYISKLKHVSAFTLATLCGLGFAIALGTKANGLIMILLWGALLPVAIKQWRKYIALSAAFFITFGLVYCGIWYTHFALGTQVMPQLPDGGYYKASREYKEYLDEGTTRNPLHFATMLNDSLDFLPHYARGVPKLDLCKEGENGSPWFYWPVGGRSINYRWAKFATLDAYQYLYLQSNPVVWLSVFIAVIVSIGILFSSFTMSRNKLQNPWLLSTFTGLYIAYMIVMARIDRVMYLYHYFIPLLFAFIVFALVFTEITHIYKWTVRKEYKTYALIVFAGCIILGYQYYRPLSYYEPIRDEAVQQKALLPVWDLHCARCKNERYLHPNTCS